MHEFEGGVDASPLPASRPRAAPPVLEADRLTGCARSNLGGYCTNVCTHKRTEGTTELNRGPEGGGWRNTKAHSDGAVSLTGRMIGLLVTAGVIGHSVHDCSQRA